MAYLIDHPPARDQWDVRTRWARSQITGCTMLHTSEGVMDTIGPDTGAEGLAAFIRGRTDPGSYHDVADSDSWLRLVPLHLGAYHDATGSNGFATSLSFACKTADWPRMTAAQRTGFLRQGAMAFADQQTWRKANGHPLTELRYITKAQSDAGMSGFCCHGWRDPGRRTDPGVAAPNLFPFDEWLEACRAAISGTPAPKPEPEDPDVRILIDNTGTMWKATDYTLVSIGTAADAALLERAWGNRIAYTQGELGALRGQIEQNRASLMLDLAKAAGGDVDESAIAAGLLPKLSEALAGASQGGGPLTREDVEAAIRGVLGSLANTPT